MSEDLLEVPELDLDAIETDVETPEVVDEPEVEETDELDATDETEGEEPAGEETPADGRKLPDAVRKALRAFRDSSPENAAIAQQLSKDFSRFEAFRQVFPDVKSAQAAQATIQTIEGLGGVAGVQQFKAEIEEVDEMLAAGDVAAVDKLAEVAGEGFDKIAVGMIDKLETTNPAAYAAAIRPHLVKAIAGTGLSGAFDGVIQALQMSKEEGATAAFKDKYEKQALKGLANIHQFLSELGKPVEQSATTPDPNAAKLTAREQAVAAAEAQAFNTTVSNQASPAMNASLKKALTPYVAKLSREQRADLTQGVYDEIAKLVNADKDYQQQKDSLFKAKKKDAAKIAQLMSNKFDSVVAQATKSVYSRRHGKGTPAVKAAVKPGTPGAKAVVPAKGAGSLASPILVKEKPAYNDVDWGRTDEKMTMHGIRVLKTGKVVKVIG
jgi:hypothetical protein